ncbi:MAG: TRAP transporter large permease, partial [Gammaproteobacteria bacterium]
MFEGLLGLAVMLGLSFLGMPIGLAMGTVGFVGLGLIRGWPASLSAMTNTFQDTTFSYTLSVIPLFVLMGNFVTRAGMAQELYRASYTFVGHRKGGLSVATILACGGFGAICGSAIATAATMARVSYPSMRKYGYDDGLAAGSIAAGGTLGILVPPSVLMILYAIMTGQNVGAMFAAGILPGLIAVICYIGAVRFVLWRNPRAGPAGERSSRAARLTALREVWPVLLLFAVVMGGMYGGIFTSIEAAGVGATGAFILAVFRARLGAREILQVLVDTVTTTAMLFVVVIGALMFANFVNFTSFPQELLSFVGFFETTPLVVVIMICAIYVVLGSVMEELSMILLTLPLFFPVILALGYEPIW